MSNFSPLYEPFQSGFKSGHITELSVTGCIRRAAAHGHSHTDWSLLLLLNLYFDRILSMVVVEPLMTMRLQLCKLLQNHCLMFCTLNSYRAFFGSELSVISNLNNFQKMKTSPFTKCSCLLFSRCFLNNIL